MISDVLWSKVIYLWKDKPNGKFFNAEVVYDYSTGLYNWEMWEVGKADSVDNVVVTHYGFESTLLDAKRAIISREALLDEGWEDTL